jgi:hypothetical protein
MDVPGELAPALFRAVTDGFVVVGVAADHEYVRDAPVPLLDHPAPAEPNT